MNYPTLQGSQVQPTGCGRMAVDTLATYWWQSRMSTAGDRAEPPELADLVELAREMRKMGWGSWPMKVITLEELREMYPHPKDCNEPE